jgi:hypothetical protein
MSENMKSIKAACVVIACAVVAGGIILGLVEMAKAYANGGML